MRLPADGREYWTPDMTALPAGYVAIQVDFGPAWVDLIDVEGTLSYLVAGPYVEELPHPPDTAILNEGRTHVLVKLIGPDGIEILVRDAGVIDVVVMAATMPPTGAPDPFLIDGGSAAA